MRKQLTTIYSVGEGRTIVFAMDGCKYCMKAFTTLVKSKAKPGEVPGLAAPTRRLQHLQSSSELKKTRFGNGSGGDKSPRPLSKEAEGVIRGTPRGSRGLEAVLDLESPKHNRSLSLEEAADTPHSLVVEDPEVPEENSIELELALRPSDRLIVALFSLSGEKAKRFREQIPKTASVKVPEAWRLPNIHKPHVSIGTILGRKKTSPTSGKVTSPKPEVKARSKTPTRAGADEEEAVADSPGARGKSEGPKVGPGHTTIFMPHADWDDIESSITQMEGEEKEALRKMARRAREEEVRFEAITLEEESELIDRTALPKAKDNVSEELSRSARRHSTRMGRTLSTFCETTEASLLVLSTLHSRLLDESDPWGVLKATEFYKLLVDKCCQSCSCPVRLVSHQQLGASLPVAQTECFLDSSRRASSRVSTAEKQKAEKPRKEKAKNIPLVAGVGLVADKDFKKVFLVGKGTGPEVLASKHG